MEEEEEGGGRGGERWKRKRKRKRWKRKRSWVRDKRVEVDRFFLCDSQHAPSSRSLARSLAPSLSRSLSLSPMLIVAWREMTSGDSGVSLETSSVERSCGEFFSEKEREELSV